MWRGHAFGLHLQSPVEIETLSPSGGTEATAPVGWNRIESRDGLPWNGDATRLVDYRFPDGSSMMSIDVDGGGAYLVEAPGYGAHVVSSDGTEITSLLAPGAGWEWQRLFAAQALPLAAAIRGLEPVHASAVSVEGRAVALSAPSGTGKTSLVMHLVAGGAPLITDDVLAIELTPAGLVGHPGARLLNADRRELATLAEGRERLGDVLGEDDKVYLRPPLAPEPLPLAALYRPVRRSGAGEVEITEEVPPDPRSVLGTSFLRYLSSPQTLTRRLELMALLARRVRVFSVAIPEGVTAAQTAAQIADHAGCVVRENLNGRPG